MNFDDLKNNLNTLNREARIDELEKLRGKINAKDIDCQYEEDYAYSYGLYIAIKLIDSRIEELKGE